MIDLVSEINDRFSNHLIQNQTCTIVAISQSVNHESAGRNTEHLCSKSNDLFDLSLGFGEQTLDLGPEAPFFSELS